MQEGVGEHSDGRFLDLELSRPGHEDFRVLPQHGRLRLDLLGLLLGCGPLRVALTVGSGKLELQRSVAHLQGRHLGIGLAQPHAQAGIVPPEPVHPGVQLR